MLIRFFRSVSALVLAAALLVPGALWAQSETDDSSNVIGAWTVRQGDLSPAAGAPSGTVSKADQDKVWSAVKKILPGSLMAQVSRFEIFQVPDNPAAASSTDGYAVLSEDGQSFTLGLNYDSVRGAFLDRDPAALKEFEPTIVHELGHILSFQPSQMDASGTARDTLVIDEGTLKPGAYLNQFYGRFWKTAYPEHGSQTTDDAAGTALYNTAPDSFVSEYAATGPLEDFAESFSRFVMAPVPSGGTVKDQKVKFFASWPELTALRTQMRAGLTTEE